MQPIGQVPLIVPSTGRLPVLPCRRRGHVRATRRAVESSDRTVLVGQFAQEALDALVDLVGCRGRRRGLAGGVVEGPVEVALAGVDRAGVSQPMVITTSSRPPILELMTAKIMEGDKPWAEERLPLVKDRIRDRMAQLSARLGDADWLDGAFSAGDLMMVSVLLRLRASGLLDEFPGLAAYVARGEARPAYERAFAAQWAINAGDLQAD